MAKKSIFQNIKKEQLDNVGMGIYNTIGICLRNHANPALEDFEKLNYTESPDIYDNILELIQKETTTDMSSFKHAFLLPSCNISTDRVKETLKEHKIYLTNDYEKADFIIAHDDIVNYDSNFKTTKMFQHIQNKYRIEDSGIDPDDPEDDVNVHVFTEFIENTGLPVLWNDSYEKNNLSLYNFNYESAHYDMYTVSDLAVALADGILKDEIQVVDIETVMDSSARKQKLTEDLLETLRTMLNNREDRTMAGAILPTVCKKSPAFFKWELAKWCNTIECEFTRNKDVKWWVEDFGLRSLSYHSAESAIEYFHNTGELTPEDFRKFEPICREDINISNRKLYSFKVQVKPEWLHYINPKKYPKLKQIKDDKEEL